MARRDPFTTGYNAGVNGAPYSWRYYALERFGFSGGTTYRLGRREGKRARELRDLEAWASFPLPTTTSRRFSSWD